MNRLLPFVVLLLLVCGCEQPPVPVSASGDAPAPDARLNLPSIPPPPSADGVQLATSETAVALGGADEPSFVVTVTAKGQFLMAPGHGVRDAKGKPLDRPTADQLRDIFEARAAADRKRLPPAEGVGADPVELPTRIAFRVDASAPFERAVPAIRAAGAAGFSKGEWRVHTPDGADGRVPFALVPADSGVVALPDPNEVRFEVTGTAAGKVQKVAKPGAGMSDGGLGLGANLDPTLPETGKPTDPKPEPKVPSPADVPGEPVAEFARLLRELAAEKPQGRGLSLLVLEVDGKVLHAEVARLADVARQNGFTNVAFAPRAAKQP